MSITNKRILEIAFKVEEARRAQLPLDSEQFNPEYFLAHLNADEEAIERIISEKEVEEADRHRQWRIEKEADGWVWGPQFNAGMKTHPHLVEYQYLPEAWRQQAVAFRVLVQELAALRAELQAGMKEEASEEQPAKHTKKHK
jgi:hypothetical protein